MNKNRRFAHKLMARDFLSREEAEKIVYRKHFKNLELEEYEKEFPDFTPEIPGIHHDEKGEPSVWVSYPE